MHEKDRALIQLILGRLAPEFSFFGGIGYISKPNGSSMVEFIVSTLKEIVNKILPGSNLRYLPD